jgi:tetratricopeptide (TPR) repeat protein
MKPMLCFSHFLVAFVAQSFALNTSHALDSGQTERQQLHGSTQSSTQKELDQREALRLFAEGALCEREERRLEAMHAYEEAAKLDPEAVAIQKALLMIYLSVGRQDDAESLLKKVLQINPRDHEMSFLHSRLLRKRGALQEACTALQNGLLSTTLRDRPDLRVQMEYDLGQIMEGLEKFEEAASAFNQAAAALDHADSALKELLNPGELPMRTAEMYERVGKNALAARQFDRAAAALHKAQAANPTDSCRLNYYLAQVSLRQGNLLEAVVALNEYLKIQPQGTDAYELLIGLMQKLRRDADIVPWLEQVSAKDPFNVPLRLLLARQHTRAGETEVAEKIYLHLADTGPSAEIYREFFGLYKEHYTTGGELVGEMISAALDTATRKDNALANSPAAAQARAMITALQENAALARAVLPDVALLAQRKSLHLDALQVFAVLADRLALYAEAEVFYGQCIRQPLPAATEPLIYGGFMRVLWKTRHYETIVETCRLGLEQTQACNRVLLRAELARALGALQRYQEAVAEANVALGEANDREGFAIRRLRVGILSQAGKFGEAEAQCRELLKERTLPADVLELRYVLANVYSLAKRNAEAEAELAECLKIDSDNAAANNDLGYMWADQSKNLPEAEAMIRKAIEQDRKNRGGALSLPPNVDKEFHDNACYIDSLGWVLFRRGQVDAAAKQLEIAVRLPDGDDPAIWDHLGDVYSALGQRRQARAAWRQALHFYDEPNRHKMDERHKALLEKVKHHNVKEAPCQAIPTGQRSSIKKGPSTPSAASCGAS